MKHFWTPILSSLIGLASAGAIGWSSQTLSPLAGALQMIFLCCVLCVLEISLSFDNALVNASVLRRMSAKWQRRFLTWGMLIAVFGMRLIFPLVLVGIIAWINPFDALIMALRDPDQYSLIMQSAHIPVVGFGGAFLLKVALGHFLHPEKDDHWITPLEARLSRLGRLRGIETIACLAVIAGMSYALNINNPDEVSRFAVAAILGLISHLLLDLLTSSVEADDDHSSGKHHLPRASAALFLYLEIQDASFSFDGVIGAFAITHNLLLITIGLGIGALFVRALTLMFVEEGTLSRYRFIETGAFYAIGSLALIMLTSAFVHVSEAIAGLTSAFIIGASLYSSILHNRQAK